ncbi:MAG: hypothetical protein LBI87_14215, partial [Candidatus Accumulibacter sp.]|nr:hypothetical protein [Accumulibacter sp.]
MMLDMIRKGLAPCFALVLCLGLAGGVHAAGTADMEAEAQKLAQDLQNGKISLPEFQKRIQELSNRLVRENTTPDQRRMYEQSQGQGAAAPVDAGRLKQAVEARMQGMEQDLPPERKSKREPNLAPREISVPRELLALLPRGKLHFTLKDASVTDAYASVSFDASVYEEAAGGEFQIRFTAYNPEFNDIAWMEIRRFREEKWADLPAEAEGMGAPLRETAWGGRGWSKYQEGVGYDGGQSAGPAKTRDYIGRYAGIVENATFSIYAHTSNANTNLEGMAG